MRTVEEIDNKIREIQDCMNECREDEEYYRYHVGIQILLGVRDQLLKYAYNPLLANPTRVIAIQEQLEWLVQK